MSRSKIAGAAAVIWISCSSPAPAAEIQVVATREDRVTRIEAVLPGPLLDLTVQQDTGAGNSLVLLVRPFTIGDPTRACDGGEAGPQLQLWRWIPPADPAGVVDMEGAGRLVLLRDDLDPGARTIQSVDLDGSGTESLATVTRGALLRLPADGSPTQRLLADPDLQPRAARFSRVGSPPREILVLAGLGHARFYRYEDSERSWRPLIEIDLPKNVRARGRGLRLDSRPPAFVGEAGGALHFATAPDALSQRRLRGVAVAVADGAVKHHEWWAGLPGDEEVLESEFILFAEEPALVVTTRPAGKLGLFGEKRLRLFRLREDRSRMGHPPFFSVQTRANLWQGVVPYVRDTDGDGLDDLVLAYWKGLKDDRLVLDVYPGTAAGVLARNPRTTAFDVKDADRTYIDFGGDVNGDGVADLLLRTRHRLLVFPGNGSADRARAIVASRPGHEVTLSESGDAAVGEAEIVISVGGDGVRSHEAVGGPPKPRRLDVDGDGRFEIVTLAPLADGRLRLTLLSFGPG